jgi:SAM-dependent methyltransferase
MLTLFPRIKPNPVMPPPPPEEKEPTADLVSAEEPALDADSVGASPVPAEIAEVAAVTETSEPARTSPVDLSPSDDSVSCSATDSNETAGKAAAPEKITDRSEIDSSLVEGPEMVAAFLSSLRDSTRKETSESIPVTGDAAGSGIAIAATNIFDEIEMLHEADAPPAPENATPRAAEDVVHESVAEAEPKAQTAAQAGEVAAEAPKAEATPISEESTVETITSGEVAPLEAGRPVAEASEATAPQEAAPAAPMRPAKRKRPQGLGFFESERIPEPEAMEDSGEVEAYASAAAQAHLDAIDDTFVAHAQLLLKGRERGRALDIGAGPGQIVLKLGYQLTRWKFVGVDRSAAMIQKALEGLATAPELAGRVEFQIADGNRLDFPNASFDLVTCNSVLHHLAEPQNLFSEIARLVKPGGAILLRDLRRPARFEFRGHVRKHGRHYSGEMKRLFVASVHAAYTPEELENMVLKSNLRGVQVFRHGKAHIGFARELDPRSK